MKNNAFIRCGQALLALGTLAVSLNAHADGVSSGSCTVDNVWRDQNQIKIHCVEHLQNYYGQTNCAGNAFSADTVRSWESMAMAALLSGKHLSILYENTGSFQCIYIVEIF